VVGYMRRYRTVRTRPCPLTSLLSASFAGGLPVRAADGPDELDIESRPAISGFSASFVRRK
jgi:hypothetical protein